MGDNQKQNFRILTSIFAACAGVVLLLTVVMIPRLRIAVACLKVASQAVSHMPLILFFPIMPLALYVAFIIWWIFVTVYLYACGSVVQSAATGHWSLSWSKQLQYAGLYHFFGLLWTTKFIVAFSQTVIAGAVATFYWCRADSQSPAIRRPIGTSLHRAWRYHLGSIALASFIVAVIQFIRAALEYLDRKTKKLQDSNPAVRFLICCAKCCMWCLEKIVTFINRNALIIVAVKGTSFCSSALRAVTLIVSNALRMTAVGAVSDVMLFLGKLLCALTGCLVAFIVGESTFYTDPTSSYYLTSPILPILVATLMAYAIGEIFFDVYDMAVDTIMLSFCDDCDRHGGEPKFAPELLQARALRFVHHGSRAAAAQAADSSSAWLPPLRSGGGGESRSHA